MSAEVSPAPSEAEQVTVAAPEAPDAESTLRARWLRLIQAAAIPVSGVAIAAAGLLVAQTAIRAWLGYRGYFFLDDFAFTARAGRYSLTDVHDYLMQSYNGHLMPGAFAQVWILTKLWPLSFAPVMTVSVVLQVLLGILFYRLLRELFGTRPTILVPYAIFLFTPITLPAFEWWAAALNQLPQQLAMVAALLCQTRYLRTGRVRTGVYGAVATFAGLLFSEKTVLTIPLVAGFTVLFFAQGGPIRRVTTAARAHWRVWLAYLVVGLPYAAYYALEVPSPGRAIANGNDVLQLFGTAFGHALDPGLLGGPWSWRRVGFVGAVADPGKFVIFLASIVVIGIVAASIAWHRNAVYGWVLGAGYAALTLGVLAASRATFIGPLIGAEYRYVTDVAAVAVVGGSLAFLRPAGDWVHPPNPLVRRAWVSRQATAPVVQDLRAALPRWRPVTAVAVLVVAFVASATASTVRFDRYWSSNPAEPYITNLHAAFADASRDLVVYDQEVPAEVAWALLFPYNQLSNLTTPWDHRPKFLELGQSTDHLGIVDSQGHIRRVGIEGIAAARGPVRNGCGWLLGPEPVQVRLVQPTFPWTWVMRMAYIASADATATIHAGSTIAKVTLHKGINELYLELVGSVDAVAFSSLPGGATVCTNTLTVGKAVPIAGTSP